MNSFDISREHCVLSILSLALSEVSWIPDFFPSITSVLQRETFRTLSSVYSSTPSCVRQRGFLASQIAGVPKAKKVPVHTSTTFISVPDKRKNHIQVLLDVSTMNTICRNSCFCKDSMLPQKQTTPY